ncbi:MAG TPA: undecaprenyl-diphosphate phosphatase [Firmicutes bacterium]|uniref:Undecaprenyl-diphosphatase n=1 Tax=Capillibacterium thermochitinicola TaxID=2699427 RepID=A0A8J6LT37_9FIRM|nr:undecaprenyl-diphosphate phosphatase [Capillibacterium thermochitinicola]MBA2133922.1 undecaprenyl-diphosphate phosphatase [Capillibacterium thermochitinicola]HHW13154.1 undecaprenyl-diphosphate phosphatase [Bacillota bacterium]
MATLILVLKSVFLGIVEGITEFLPVSSTGHLVIAENLIGFRGESPHYVEMYTYVIQLGAICAVVALYWDKIRATLVNFFPRQVGFARSGFKFWFTILVACIPGGILGVLFDDLAEQYLFAPVPVAIALFGGGLLMLYAEKRLRDNRAKGDIWDVSLRQAWTIGLFQCLAIIPGMSRSASTIIGGWVAGLTTVAATEFSFFLAIPVMVGMSTLKIAKLGGLGLLTMGERLSLVVGFVISFLVALAVVDGFIAYLKKKPMRIFALYRLVFAVIVLGAGLAGFF